MSAMEEDRTKTGLMQMEIADRRAPTARAAARFDGIIASAMDAIISIDAEQRIILFNPAAEKMFAVTAENALGHHLNRFIPERFHAAHIRHIEHFAQTGVSTRRMGALGKIYGLRANGQEFPIEASISQVNVNGETLFTVILRDITLREQADARAQQMKEEIVLRARELLRANAYLSQSEERLRAANRELNDFATIVSHDLKSPLRAVASLAKWVQSDYADKLDDEGRENLAEMVRRVSRMDRMIDGILQYSRLGRMEEKLESVALAELVPSVVEDLAPPAHAHVYIAPGLPVVFGEAVRLRQLFQNLIGNALKHGDKPQVEIQVEWADSEPMWQFSVTDNGPGIEERHFDRIFKIFQTLAPKDKTDSTGIGLALVQRIVERAGGRVWVESRVGEGSAFRFTWPKGTRATASPSLERMTA